MPLIKSASKKAIGKNIEAEMSSGKPHKQSIAIALNVQRQAKRKKMAYGGKAEETNEPAVPQRKKDDMRPPEDEFMADHFAYGGKARDTNEPSMPQRKPDDKRFPEDEYMSTDKWSKGSPPARKPDDERLPMDEYMADHFAEGGMAEDDKHYDSVSEAIMARKRREKMMADGGMVDLSENADEEPNNEDQMSFEALRKENYSESAGLEHLDQPEDSNLHGHELSDEDEHDGARSMRHDFPERSAEESSDGDDMVSSIRKRMKSRRG